MSFVYKFDLRRHNVLNGEGKSRQKMSSLRAMYNNVIAMKLAASYVSK